MRTIGTVAGLWRYPVKSMAGEPLEAAEVTVRGVTGDRAYAVVDAATGVIASAKHAKRWPGLFESRARLLEAPESGADPSPVAVTLPDGRTAASTEGQRLAELLSAQFGRAVRLCDRPPAHATAEQADPDTEVLSTFTLPAGTFFDEAVLHLVATATLAGLEAGYPSGRFDVRRFRPNLLIATPAATEPFPEDEWRGRRLAIGDAVRIAVTDPTVRCVMTTLATDGLPRDPGILRAAAQRHRAEVGAYAIVLAGGTVRQGDPVRIAEAGE